MTDCHDGERRCGYIAIVGAPNAGKSTLVNQLVGTKVSIVTPKVQTTRARITAIGIVGCSQLIFIDTPGIFVPKRKLEQAMVNAAWSGAQDADLVALMVDSKRGRDDDTMRIVAGLKKAGRNAVLVLNKVDIANKQSLLQLAAEFQAETIVADTFMISAMNGDGVADLSQYFSKQVPPGPWLYPEDQLADIPERLLAAEITREQIFLRLHQELPYAITVETESWKQQANGIKIEQVIYVSKPTHKAIVLGKGGSMIKQIGQVARQELRQALGAEIHLFLFVKVRERWLEDPERYREMGLEFPKAAR